MEVDQNRQIQTLQSVTEVLETVRRLRAPGGCPWDRAQTHQSLRPFLIEEAYEVLDVLDQVHTPEDLKDSKVKEPLKEELGDLLMQVLLHAEMTKEAGAFDFFDVARTLNEKLIRRHPHVFGEGENAKTAEQALGSWEKTKAEEKSKKKQAEGNGPASVLEGIPKGLPSLQKTARVIEKVTKVGFQWSDLKGPMDKVEEEWAELKIELETFEKESVKTEETRARIQSEIGDLLFCVANIAYLMKVNPEDALRGTLNRFEGRFRHVENRLFEIGKRPQDSNLEEMDRYWDEAKTIEKQKDSPKKESR